jgi:hypothetical protein
VPPRSSLPITIAGECENRIEEFKNGFLADRLSCHRFLANAFRLLLHAAAIKQAKVKAFWVFLSCVFNPS